jgi:7-keto-8-aminopelargonate synthetase-like enzyme
MSQLFHGQLQALRTQSLHRKLREIATAQGPEVRIVGQQLVNFSSNDYLGLANDSAISSLNCRGRTGAIDLACSLQSEGFLVPAIRCPTVAKGAARLRITVAAAHAETQITTFCAALARHAGARLSDPTPSV